MRASLHPAPGACGAAPGASATPDTFASPREQQHEHDAGDEPAQMGEERDAGLA